MSALTNIVGTFLGALYQTVFLMDSQRPVVNPLPEGSAVGMELRRYVVISWFSGEDSCFVVIGGRRRLRWMEV
jgi:hypothetical protein